MFDHAKLQIQGLGPPWALTPGPGYFCHTKTASSLRWMITPMISWLKEVSLSHQAGLLLTPDDVRKLVSLLPGCCEVMSTDIKEKLTSHIRRHPDNDLWRHFFVQNWYSCVLIMVSMLHNPTQRGAVGISVDSGTGFYPVFSVYLRHFNRIFLLSSYFCFLFFQLMSLNTSNSQHLQRQDNTN